MKRSASRRSKTRSKASTRTEIYVGRVAVLIAFLALWQYLPKLHWLSEHFRFLDPYFISSPSDVIKTIGNYALGRGGRPLVWPYLWDTLSHAFEGLVIATAIGFVVGLVLSSSPKVAGILGIYINAINAVPRVALIPIVLAMVGTNATAEIVNVILVVFFIVFYNCFEGGRQVPRAMLENMDILQASRVQVMTRIRVRYVSLWAFAAIPNAVAHAALGVMLIQMIAGTGGVGLLLLVSTNNIDTASSLSLVVYLGISAIILVQLSELAKRRLLHWADSQA